MRCPLLNGVGGPSPSLSLSLSTQNLTWFISDRPNFYLGNDPSPPHPHPQWREGASLA